jgi:transcriptional regulator with XRE-family HTH domain
MSLTISEVQPGSESFQGLVLRFRGRTALTQGQVAARAHASLRSIQAWEAGISYPGTENLQALISCFLEAGGFARGREAAEAKAFWSAAVCEMLGRHRPRLANQKRASVVWCSAFGDEQRSLSHNSRPKWVRVSVRSRDGRRELPSPASKACRRS